MRLVLLNSSEAAIYFQSSRPCAANAGLIAPPTAEFDLSEDKVSAFMFLDKAPSDLIPRLTFLEHRFGLLPC
jgi:hypothetical protein